jgi:hypothetical protein
MTKNKQITEFKNEKQQEPRLGTSKYSAVIDDVAPDGSTIQLGFNTDEDYKTFIECCNRAREFVKRANRGEFD